MVAEEDEPLNQMVWGRNIIERTRTVDEIAPEKGISVNHSEEFEC